ncbi:uncharacterized protein BDZ99DRAFT_461660 [Mytilinidion resinicola]|uniref:Uncharacterized protein n=1 Tax=Mytilinidion resinicola TaxID=574789 RepID=A0A6A6YUN0_9PEZI|nr:uncharacterized protein BDZ99DRAFT_461660 [Mytilinidion resinicola]KAF2811647.1 hypothetical protein BDZ99DRAFT_461660 [Mytilinidion resinicola]
MSLDSNTATFPLKSHISKGHLEYQRLAGFQVAARNLFSASARLSDPTFSEVSSGTQPTFSTVYWNVDTVGSLASEHFQLPDGVYPNTCSQGYSDPTDQIVSSLSRLIFRSAVAAGRDAPSLYGNYEQDVAVQQTTSEVVYVSHYVFYYIAAAIMVVAMLGTITTLHGWWRLGRAVSMSPLETAKAFSEELLHGDGTSNAEVGDLLRVVGRRRVMYGEIVITDSQGVRERKVLRFGHPDDVRAPVRGDVFE